MLTMNAKIELPQCIVCKGLIKFDGDMFYIARKVMERDKLRQALSDLLLAVYVCPIDHSILAGAFALPFTDYVDKVQCASAMASQMDAIVTRNLADYKNAALPVLSPTDFLNRVKSS